METVVNGSTVLSVLMVYIVEQSSHTLWLEEIEKGRIAQAKCNGSDMLTAHARGVGHLFIESSMRTRGSLVSFWLPLIIRSWTVFFDAKLTCVCVYFMVCVVPHC